MAEGKCDLREMGDLTPPSLLSAPVGREPVCRHQRLVARFPPRLPKRKSRRLNTPLTAEIRSPPPGSCCKNCSRALQGPGHRASSSSGLPDSAFCSWAERTISKLRRSATFAVVTAFRSEPSTLCSSSSVAGTIWPCSAQKTTSALPQSTSSSACGALSDDRPLARGSQDQGQESEVPQACRSPCRTWATSRGRLEPRAACSDPSARVAGVSRVCKSPSTSTGSAPGAQALPPLNTTQNPAPPVTKCRNACTTAGAKATTFSGVRSSADSSLIRDKSPPLKPGVVCGRLISLHLPLRARTPARPIKP